MSSFTQELQAPIETDYRSNFYRSPERLNQIIQSLFRLPNYWKLVPCIDKQPLGKRWQQNYYSPQILFRSLSQEGKIWVRGNQGFYAAVPNGYSLLCGQQQSGRYLIALDCDSIEALNQVKAMGFPTTVSYSSGRPGRRQFLYYIDQPITSFKLKNGLEVRGKNLLVTLPPSVHPLTGKYRWIIAPDQLEIPTISSLWLNILKPKLRSKLPQIKAYQHGHLTVSRATAHPCPHQTVEDLVNLINPIYADVYDDWIRVGMALKDWDAGLLWLWDRWSQSSSKYKTEECSYRWSSFNGSGITYRTIYYYVQIS